MRSYIPSSHHFGAQREMIAQEEHFPSTHFIRYSGYPSPTPSFRAQREIFLALCSFLLLSRKDSPFPLSHIRRYTGVQERSLDSASDDNTGIALSKHFRCTLHEINPFPIPSLRAQREIFLAPCSFLLLSRKDFPSLLSHIGHYTGVPKRSLDFARDDDTGIALSKHIRCTLLEINPFPHTVISSAVEKSSLHSALSCSFRKRVPLFRYHTYGAIPVCKKDPSAPLPIVLGIPSPFYWFIFSLTPIIR